MAKAKTQNTKNTINIQNTMTYDFIKKPDLVIQIKTLDHNGDSILEKKIAEALEDVAKKHFNFGMWPFVGGTEYFQFTATSMDDTAAFFEDCKNLYNKILTAGEPIVVMTPDLQGGSK